MNYRSVADLACVVRENLHLVPADIDLVVGIPRSGLLAASLVALGLNLKVTDVEGWLSDGALASDNLRASRFPELSHPSQARHVLLVDDSILSGRSLAAVHARLLQGRRTSQISTCAIYATRRSRPLVDVAFELVEPPRAFEWNLMHRELLSCCCVDIDGVLCADPSDSQNDDGDGYLAFLGSVPPTVKPSHEVGHLVTARLEKYRPQTEEWLSRHGIRYGALHMLDLPDAVTRRKMGSHARHKAQVYRGATNATLFIESDDEQAIEIARLSGKRVLCYRTQRLIAPGPSIQGVVQVGARLRAALQRAMRRHGLRGR